MLSTGLAVTAVNISLMNQSYDQFCVVHKDLHSALVLLVLAHRCDTLHNCVYSSKEYVPCVGSGAL